ncbi:Uncharacterised protein [Klebsiella pneumoniae]|nr:Uncharacterised protein [Klebsiella pneumoniae]SVS23145.1 Uncharacterised protein [Klebsiella pneumoniae]
MINPALLVANRALMTADRNIPRLFKSNDLLSQGRMERHRTLILAFFCRAGVFVEREAGINMVIITDQ